MSEYIPAYIRIGGLLSLQYLESFVECLNKESVGFEFGGMNDTWTSSDVYEIIENEDYFICYLDQAPWGEFTYLEKFCQEQRLPYNRLTEGYFNYNPFIVYYRPELYDGVPQEFYCLPDTEETLVPASKIYQTVTAFCHMTEYSCDILTSQFKELCAKNIPTLPKFIIMKT